MNSPTNSLSETIQYIKIDNSQLNIFNEKSQFAESFGRGTQKKDRYAETDESDLKFCSLNSMREPENLSTDAHKDMTTCLMTDSYNFNTGHSE